MTGTGFTGVVQLHGQFGDRGIQPTDDRRRVDVRITGREQRSVIVPTAAVTQRRELYPARVPCPVGEPRLCGHTGGEHDRREVEAVEGQNRVSPA